jgi:hypothetical protein
MVHPSDIAFRRFRLFGIQFAAHHPGKNYEIPPVSAVVKHKWTTNANFNSTNATQSVFVTPSDPVQFYRLNFPFVWTWP